MIPSINTTTSSQPLLGVAGQTSRAPQPIRTSAPTLTAIPRPQLQGFQESLAALSSALRTFSSFASAQRAADRAAGVPVWKGALSAGATVANGAEALYRAASTTQDDSVSSLLSSLAKEGVDGYLQDGKQAILTNFGREALSLTARNLGLESTSSLLSKGAGAAVTEVSTAGSAISSFGTKALGFVGAAYSGYELFKNFGHSTPAAGAIQGATAGAYIGSCIVPGIGTIVGGAIGGIVGGLMGAIKTGKHKDQVARDHMRSALQKAGMVDDKWCVKLADGTGYDIGKDGGAKLKNLDAKERHVYDVDLSDPLAIQVSSSILPVARQICGGNEKLAGDLTGYLTNAALSNSHTMEGANANLRSIFAKLLA